MKNIWICLVAVCAVCIISCKKEGFITSPNATLLTSADTLRFDTVFTTTGSVTQSFKIFNQNNEKLRLNKVQLMGGITSAFKMNVDGSAGTLFDNVEIEPNDSIYVFVSVSINPNTANLPFVVEDSILINFNGNDRFVQLQAYGQNANFIRSQRISSNTTWNNNLPYVILGGVLIDENVTLTINKGSRIYFHADAPMLVNGTLKVNGERYDSTRVIFKGDRLDPYYRDFPGSWPGIYFNPSSKDNILNFAVINNAYQGIITEGFQGNSAAKITLNECIIDNIYDIGILSLNSSINARNCLVSNCGTNVVLASGGIYNFNHCTVATYGNGYVSHKNPVLYISNANAQNQTFRLNASFTNSIFYGEGGAVEDEIIAEKKGTPSPPEYAIKFENVLYKAKKDPVTATFVNPLKTDPLFDTINAGRRIFNFRLGATSPAIDKGRNIPSLPASTDLDGNSRPSGAFPDLGCYEKQQ